METTRHNREISILDQVLVQIDQGLRTLFAGPPVAQRENPAATEDEAMLSAQEQRHGAGLMRVNHVGEICAQGLYQGQAITARTDEIRQAMQKSADEENDHLAWCEGRLKELNSRTSYLNPVWHFGSLLLGLIAGIAGDKWSLGFVAETENQVVKHLNSHLDEISPNDKKSRKIIEQMREDEEHHATVAMEFGAADLPGAVKKLMTVMASIMTTAAYYV